MGRAERDRSNDGEVDTWESYDAGLLTQSAYDDNRDGEAEKWEVFRNGRLIEIRYDTDRDGRPDRREEIPEDSAGPLEERINCVILEDAPAEPAPAPTAPPAETPAEDDIDAPDDGEVDPFNTNVTNGEAE